MSVRAMTWVFDNSPYELGTRLVHLAIADSVNDENGNEWWGGNARLAAKAHVNERTVERAKARMIADGLLTDLRMRHPSGHRVYRFEMPRPDNLSGRRNRHSVANDPTTATPSPLTNSKRTQTTSRTSSTSRGEAREAEVERRDQTAEIFAATELAREMMTLLADNDCRVPPALPDRWVADFSKLLRLDKRPYGEILRVLRWTLADEFEQAVVLSPGKFRARYDSLRLKAERTRRTKIAGYDRAREVAIEILGAIKTNGRNRRPEKWSLPGSAEVVDLLGWGNLCGMDERRAYDAIVSTAKAQSVSLLSEVG